MKKKKTIKTIYSLVDCSTDGTRKVVKQSDNLPDILEYCFGGEFANIFRTKTKKDKKK